MVALGLKTAFNKSSTARRATGRVSDVIFSVIMTCMSYVCCEMVVKSAGIGKTP